MFVFNGELRGVRVKADGRIGAEKIFNYVKRFDRGDLGAALERYDVVWFRLAPRIDAFTTAFYDRLFLREPAVRRLFPANLREQRLKLADALELAVRSLGHQIGLVPLLESLGEKHAAYGVTEAHFTLVGEVLIATLERFEGEHWTEATAAAWARAYAEIASAMQRGLRRAVGSF